MKILKKKAQLQRIIEVIILLILLVLVITIFFAPEGLLQKVAEKSEVFKKFIPVRQPTEPKQELTASEEQKKEFDGFCDALKKYRESENCLLPYSELSSLEEFTIRITIAENSLYAQLLNPHDQTTENSCSIPGLIPCAVAGKNKAAINFYNNYLDDLQKIKSPKDSPEFSEPDQIFIGWECTDGNEKCILVHFKDGWKIKEDMEDANIIYKPDKNHVCFFPTYDGDWLCDADEEGLDDACLLDSKENIQNVISTCK
ncbi:hypothetical protein KY332_03170 [Candidatus Woesearchaeota archaeon]|nr:hypothetical protein [Candidatus Woesearchaeota archaeon]